MTSRKFRPEKKTQSGDDFAAKQSLFINSRMRTTIKVKSQLIIYTAKGLSYYKIPRALKKLTKKKLLNMNFGSRYIVTKMVQINTSIRKHQHFSDIYSISAQILIYRASSNIVL